jgi:diadenosine tetraphosphatase ApaH/serine/threonine PP2A family protein phosphatase
MKWALFSDIHANWQAFSTCLAHAQAQEAERFAVLGDTVGYGGDPGPVLDAVMQLHAQGAVVLQGNHDAMAVHPQASGDSVGSMTAAWTHQQLRTDQRQFLAQLPLVQQQSHMLLVHASAHRPERWSYVDNERSAQQCLNAALEAVVGSDTAPQVHVFVGHVHQQRLFYQGTGRGLMAFEPTPGVAMSVPQHRSWVATVGSVGQPRDGNPKAMYALYDDTQCRIVFQRLAYDHSAAAARIRRAGLPEYFAQRLEEGR